MVEANENHAQGLWRLQLVPVPLAIATTKKNRRIAQTLPMHERRYKDSYQDQAQVALSTAIGARWRRDKTYARSTKKGQKVPKPRALLPPEPDVIIAKSNRAEVMAVPRP